MGYVSELSGRVGRPRLALNCWSYAWISKPVAELYVEGDLAKSQEGEHNCHQRRRGAEQTYRHPTPRDVVIQLASICQLVSILQDRL